MNIPTISIENIEEMKVIYVRFRGAYIEFRKQSKKMFKTDRKSTRLNSSH